MNQEAAKEVVAAGFKNALLSSQDGKVIEWTVFLPSSHQLNIRFDGMWILTLLFRADEGVTSIRATQILFYDALHTLLAQVGSEFRHPLEAISKRELIEVIDFLQDRIRFYSGWSLK